MPRLKKGKNSIGPKAQRQATIALPSTIAMVNAALTELHTKRGFSLYALKKCITSKYGIMLTRKRNDLVKKHLHTLLSTNELVNTTGKGLTGSFRLRDLSQQSQGNKEIRHRKHRVMAAALLEETPQQVSEGIRTPLAPLQQRSRLAHKSGQCGTPLSSHGGMSQSQVYESQKQRIAPATPPTRKNSTRRKRK